MIGPRHLGGGVNTKHIILDWCEEVFYCITVLVSTIQHCAPYKMWIAVGVISLALVAILFKYVLGSSGPNPFGIDTREPLKPMVLDRKLKNKVLKQGKVYIHTYLHKSFFLQ